MTPYQRYAQEVRTFAATLLEVARLRQTVKPCRYRAPHQSATVAIDPTHKPDVSDIISALNAAKLKAQVIR